MFAKLSSTLFVAGVMVVAADSSSHAQDYLRSNWSSRPNPLVGDSRGLYDGYRSGSHGIAVGGCYPDLSGSGRWGSGFHDSVWSRDPWDVRRDSRYDSYGNSLPYRSSSYLPAYRPSNSTYRNSFHHNLPGYGRSTWNVDRPYLR